MSEIDTLKKVIEADKNMIADMEKRTNYVKANLTANVDLLMKLQAKEIK